MGTPAGIRFAVFTDPHIGATTANSWHNHFLTDTPIDILNATVEAVNHDRPDFVVITGDLSDTASVAEFRAARSALDRLNAPYIVCHGNHDRAASGDRSVFDRIFGDRAPAGFVARQLLPLPVGVAAVVFDAEWSNEGERWRVCIPDEQVERTAGEVQKLQPEILLVFCHFPFVDQIEYIRSRAEDGKNAGSLDHGEAVLERLSAHSGMTLAFAGHQHFHHIIQRDHWLHCTTASLAEYPAEYRVVAIEPRRVTIRTASGAREIVAANPPDVTWVRGRAEDREIRWDGT